MTGLNPKQERFCHEYIVDLNATQAAIRAGYSPKSARQIASQHLSKHDIQDKIAALRRERNEQTKVSAAWVVQRLRDIIDYSMNLDDADALRGERAKEKGFNAGVAVRALDILGRHLGMFEPDVERYPEEEAELINQQTSEANRLARAIIGRKVADGEVSLSHKGCTCKEHIAQLLEEGEDLLRKDDAEPRRRHQAPVVNLESRQ